MYGYDFSAPTQTSVTTSSPYTQLTQSLDATDGALTAYHLPTATGNATFKNVWSASHVGDMAAGAYKTSGCSAVSSAPTGVSTAAGNNQATISWTAPAETGGNPILGYVVTANPGGRLGGRIV